MKFEIKHRFTRSVLFSLECDSFRICVEAAVKQKVRLSDADLRGADLSDADMSGAYMRGADMRGADMRGADMRGAVDEETAIANLDRVREIILDDKRRLDMGNWHSDSGWKNRTCAEETLCNTTHCMAGWLQACSTDEKVRKLDPWIAGTTLAPVASKMFYRGNHEVLEWLEKREYVTDTLVNLMYCDFLDMARDDEQVAA